MSLIFSKLLRNFTGRILYSHIEKELPMPVSTSETAKSIGMKDAALFRQQVYIDGKWSDADSGETTAITNPSTGNVLGTVPNLSLIHI